MKSYAMTVKLSEYIKNKVESMRAECPKHLSCCTCPYDNGNPASMCKSEMWSMICNSEISEVKEK